MYKRPPKTPATWETRLAGKIMYSLEKYRRELPEPEEEEEEMDRTESHLDTSRTAEESAIRVCHCALKLFFLTLSGSTLTARSDADETA